MKSGDRFSLIPVLPRQTADLPAALSAPPNQELCVHTVSPGKPAPSTPPPTLQSAPPSARLHCEVRLPATEDLWAPGRVSAPAWSLLPPVSPSPPSAGPPQSPWVAAGVTEVSPDTTRRVNRAVVQPAAIFLSGVVGLCLAVQEPSSLLLLGLLLVLSCW